MADNKQSCDSCSSSRLMSVYMESPDKECVVKLDNYLYSGIGIPSNINLGGYTINFSICADCGHVNGKWPLTYRSVSENEDNDSDDEQWLLQN